MAALRDDDDDDGRGPSSEEAEKLSFWAFYARGLDDAPSWLLSFPSVAFQSGSENDPGETFPFPPNDDDGRWRALRRTMERGMSRKKGE